MRIPRPVVVPMQIQPRFHPFGDFAAVLEPPAHPDARPWPHGMVIGPPRTPDPIAARLPSAVDNLLSALLAPWLSVAS